MPLPLLRPPPAMRPRLPAELGASPGESTVIGRPAARMRDVARDSRRPLQEKLHAGQVETSCGGLTGLCFSPLCEWVEPAEIVLKTGLAAQLTTGLARSQVSRQPCGQAGKASRRAHK